MNATKKIDGLIAEFVEYRTNLGLSAHTERLALRQFSETYPFVDEIRLGADEYESYMSRFGSCCGHTLHDKSRAILLFFEYAEMKGYAVHHVQPTRKPKNKPVHAFIFTDEQLKAFFNAIDNYPLQRQSTMNVVDPVMFRLIYGCGLRLSEALRLRIGDIHLDEGCLTILGSKNGKDRQTPFVESIGTRIKSYIRDHRRGASPGDVLFANRMGMAFSKSATELRFRDYVYMAGIPRSEGRPRIHDLRHTFAVHCLRRWWRNGIDLTNALPYLSAYMGHTTCDGTEYYLHLTSDLFPEIVSKMDEHFGDIVAFGKDAENDR